MKLVLGEVHMTNVNRATVEEQQRIATQVVGFCFLDGDLDALKAAIRDAFEQVGFFKAMVGHVDVSVLNKDASPPTVTVTARIEEGHQYRLKEVKFSGNKAIANADALRRLIPMEDGDIFNTELMRTGIKNLRDAYGRLGYINFTSVPDTEMDDKNHTVTVKLDLDDGMQFYVRSFEVTGADAERKRALLDRWMLRPGSVYDFRLADLFFTEAKDLLPPGARPEYNLITIQDNQQGMVDIVLDLGRPSTKHVVPLR